MADDVEHPAQRLVEDDGGEVLVVADGLAGQEREPQDRPGYRDRRQGPTEAEARP